MSLSLFASQLLMDGNIDLTGGGNTEGIFGNFFSNATQSAIGIGGLILGFLGVVAVVASVIFTVTKLLKSQDRGERSWVKVIGLFVIGGALVAGGMTLLATASEGAQTQLVDLIEG